MRGMIESISNVEISTLTMIIAPLMVSLIIVFSLKTYGDRARKLPSHYIKSQSPTILSDFLTDLLSKYGNKFTIKFLGKKVIFSANPDLNSFVVQNENRLFDNAIPSHTGTLFGRNSDLFAVASNQRYKHMKSLVVKFLHSWEIQTSFLEEVQKAADRVLNSWKDTAVVYLNREAKRFAFNIIAEKTLGLNADDPEGKEFRKEFFTFDEGFYSAPINLPSTNYWKALKARKNIVKFIKKKVESKKREEKENTKPTDWIDWLLKDKTQEPVEKLCDAVIAITFGGLVNNSKAISLAIYLLANCPKAVQQMREEYLEILRSKEDDNAALSWNDYKNLKFTHCVINETLRLGNVTPGLAKKAKQDTDFKGYVIPKGTTVVCYIAATHLDPNAFEKPEIFDPWRWQSIKKTNSWMPFGGGIRQCNGAEIARIEMAIFLQRFLLNYNWEPAEADHPIAHPVGFPKELPIRVYPLNSNI